MNHEASNNTDKQNSNKETNASKTENQNPNHNTKKVSLGPNTKR